MLCFSLLVKHNIQSTILVQDPENWKNIGIIGINVGLLKPDLDQVREKFPEFSFAVEEKKSLLYTDHQSWSPAATVERKTPVRFRTDEWHAVERATAELLISADETSKENPNPNGGVYAVVPAHMLLEEEQRERYASGTNMISLSREEVERKTTRTSFSLQLVENMKVFDLRHPPLLCYRHWFTTTLERSHASVENRGLAQGMTVTTCPLQECACIREGECHHLYMNDIALMCIDHTAAQEVQQMLKDKLPQRVEKLKNIGSKKHLETLCRKKQNIVIGEGRGQLTRMPCNLFTEKERNERQKYAMHLPFILTSTNFKHERQ